MNTRAICEAIYDTSKAVLGEDGEFDLLAQDDEVKDAALLTFLLTTPADEVNDIALDSFCWKETLCQAVMCPHELGMSLGHKAYLLFESKLRNELWEAFPKYFNDCVNAVLVDNAIREQKEAAA